MPKRKPKKPLQDKKDANAIQPFIVETKKTGRKRKFDTGEDLFEAFKEYCVFQLSRKRPITKTSFKAYMLINHSYFSDLGEEFSATIKQIDMICKAYAEEELFVGRNVAGVIFNLCNNYSDDYKNSKYMEHSGKIQTETIVHKVGVTKDSGKQS